MHVRNFLAPGDFVLPVPVGLNITLQYDEKGLIQKLLIGLDNSGDELPIELLHAVLPVGIIPKTIPVKQGTSWVSGVFTRPGQLSTASGMLPDDILEDISVQLMEAPETFKFYATSVISNAVQFTGGMSSQKWLQSTGFETLPNYVIPATAGDDQVDKIVAAVDYIVVGLLVLHQWKWEYVSLDRRQDTVVSVTKQYDELGYFRGTILTDSSERFDADYFDIVKYNIQPKSIVVHDQYRIVKVYPSNDKRVRDPRPSKLECPVCGSMMNITQPDSMCPNDKCPSRWYEATQHFLAVLDLPKLPRTKYLEKFKGYSEVRFDSLFELPEYHDQHVSVSPAKLIRAVVPVTVVRSDRAIAELCSSCNNSIQAIMYHLQHIDRVFVDLGLSAELAQALQPLNGETFLLDEIDTLFHHPNINIDVVDVKFDGPPIFRGKRIGLTGKFLRGSYDEISAILRSYSAEVIPNSADVDCVVVGGTSEDIVGSVVKDARWNHVPVFTEDQFFAQYEIDQDIAGGAK